ncbi:MAG: rhomboid family intramembrane serine protease [Syntrophorhabdaceae bacterium]|nr:rhomboid family intramembrane serine protease [Syntrophorhabdaceae bacterium]
MIPLKDNIPTRTLPIITGGLIFVNIIIFVWQHLFLHVSASATLYTYYGLVPREFIASVVARHDLLPYNVMTIFTSMFLHGGFLHIIGNMLYLWIFGNNIEDRLGHAGYLLFYLLSGICAAAFQVFYDPSSEIPMIGASGAVSGILGAYLLVYPHARIKTLLIIVVFIKIVDIPAILLLTVWFFMQFLYSNVDGIAWYAHVGGFIFGLLFALLFMVRKGSRKAAGA